MGLQTAERSASYEKLCSEHFLEASLRDENVEKDIFCCVMKSKELKFKFKTTFTLQDLNLNFEIQNS